MTIEAQITRLNHCVEGLVRSIASLDDELYFRKVNGWSPRDILAHLVGWNRYVIRGCEQIKNGELPFYNINPGENYRNINAILVREYSSCDRQELLDELEASARELREFLQSQDLGDWNHDYGVKNQGATLTIENTVDDLIADYAHHRERINEWAQKQAAS